MSNYSDDWDKSVNAQDYVAVVYSYISLIAMIIIVTCFTMALCKRKSSAARSGGDTQSDNEQETPEIIERRRDIKAITSASIVAIILYLLSSILFPAFLTKWIVIGKEHGNADNNRLITLPIIPYIMNTMVVLMFILLRRLKTSFIGNKPETKHIRRRLHCLSWTLPAVFFIANMIPAVNGVVAPLPTSVVNAAAALLVGVSIIGYFIISAVYLKQISRSMAQKIIPNVSRMEMERAKMVQGVAMTEALQNDDNNDNDNGNDEVEVIVDLQTINDTIRCALLIVLCTLSNCLFPLSLALSATQVRHESHRDTLRYFGMMTDIVCNTLCLCLLFKFSEIWYFRLCGPCHECALQCCVNKVGREFVKKNPNHSHQDYVELILK